MHTYFWLPRDKERFSWDLIIPKKGVWFIMSLNGKTEGWLASGTKGWNLCPYLCPPRTYRLGKHQLLQQMTLGLGSLTQHKMSLFIDYLRVSVPLLWAGIPGPSLPQPRAPKVSSNLGKREGGGGSAYVFTWKWSEPKDEEKQNVVQPHRGTSLSDEKAGIYWHRLQHGWGLKIQPVKEATQRRPVLCTSMVM